MLTTLAGALIELMQKDDDGAAPFEFDISAQVWSSLSKDSVVTKSSMSVFRADTSQRPTEEARYDGVNIVESTKVSASIRYLQVISMQS